MGCVKRCAFVGAPTRSQFLHACTGVTAKTQHSAAEVRSAALRALLLFPHSDMLDSYDDVVRYGHGRLV